jgi:hypothetical protein
MRYVIIEGCEEEGGWIEGTLGSAKEMMLTRG